MSALFEDLKEGLEQAIDLQTETERHVLSHIPFFPLPNMIENKSVKSG